jgi:multiple sugar transport system substrate-binding protein
MKRLAAAAMIVLLLLTAGCGGKKNGPVTLKMWIMPNSQEPVNDLQSVLAPFLKENPDIKIEITSLDWGSAWSKLTTAATSSDVPDIVQIGSTWLGAIASMGALDDLTERFTSENLKGKYMPLPLTNIGIAKTGKIYSLPWVLDVRAMFYRTDVLSQLKISPKEMDTWAGLDKVLAKIKAANLVINGKKVAPLGITGKNDWNIIHNIAPWIYMAGGNFIDKSLTRSIVASKESVNGFDYYIDFVRKGYVPISCLEQNTAQISSGFNNGLYAVYFDGPYALRTLTLPPERGGSSNLPVAKNFGISLYPRSPLGTRVTYGGGSNLAMFKASRNKDAAWKVLKYLSLQKEAQIAYAQLTGFLPVSREAFQEPYFRSDPYRKVFMDSVKYGRNYPSIERWAQLETVVFPRRLGIIWNKIVENPLAFKKPQLTEELNLLQDEINTLLQAK